MTLTVRYQDMEVEINHNCAIILLIYVCINKIFKDILHITNLNYNYYQCKIKRFKLILKDRKW